ncbi:hypothetical protein Pla123a_43500 [Posidoniimonas polymericola]|uniref:Uncharacterized protein n=1 Tax=Posidoniimonas polymericola TaxID=2528002 RepID=A0A5C5XWN9_9BACT|nr:hypothetical protein [Posidoniimonas polymericola]TWT66921.1 hypothetical protein Pla123a_43500 [Posidoniimonas polymericola]
MTSKSNISNSKSPHKAKATPAHKQLTLGRSLWITGDKAALKTAIALDLAFSANTSTKFLNYFELPYKDPEPVFYFEGHDKEIDMQIVRDRIAVLERSRKGVRYETIFRKYPNSVALQSPNGPESLQANVEREEAKLCLLDHPRPAFPRSLSAYRFDRVFFRETLDRYAKCGEASKCTMALVTLTGAWGHEADEEFGEWAETVIHLDSCERTHRGIFALNLCIKEQSSERSFGLTIDQGWQDQRLGGNWDVTVRAKKTKK